MWGFSPAPSERGSFPPLAEGHLPFSRGAGNRRNGAAHLAWQERENKEMD